MNGTIKMLLAGFALVSMEAGAATASSEGTQPIGVLVYTLHGSNTLRCEKAYINPASVQVWKSVKASTSGFTFDSSCPTQATVEGIMLDFHALHRSPSGGSHTHGGGSFLYGGSELDFRADLRNRR